MAQSHKLGLENQCHLVQHRGALRALAILILAPAFALGAVAGAAGLVGGAGPKTQSPNSLVWADRVFVNRHALAGWLEARGVAFEAWAQRHPAAARAFGDRSDRTLAASSRSRLDEHSRRRTRQRHALLAGLLAGLSLAILLVIYALRARIARYSSRYRKRDIPRRRRPTTRNRAPSAGFRRPIRLPPSPLAAARRRAWSLVDFARPLVWIRLRHFLPKIAFYAISALLALTVGAAVAIYLQ